jgi:hypothetical protein
MIAALFTVGIAFIVVGLIALEAIDACYEKKSGSEDVEE